MPLQFEPWIGDRYESGGLLGMRVLILGESHYGNDGWVPPELTSSEFTSLVVRRHGIVQAGLSGAGRVAFFTKVAKTILGLPGSLSVETRAAFWNSVAFYNYIQAWLPAPRQRPTGDMWNAARQPFLDVLSRRRPAAVVVLGVQLWQRLPPADGMLNLFDQELRLYHPRDSVSCCAGFVRHPSSAGFRYDPWRTRVQDLFKEARVLHANRAQAQ